jgi:lipopolysaccharide transport system ATP-binding protein
MSSDVLIRCEKVGKTFCRDLKKSLWYGVKDCAADLFGRRSTTASTELRAGEFWANKDVSFEVKRGECLGLIGRNGAGKTTLLKMLTGLIKPDFGVIELHGRVCALIALGAGFNPILTGRENVFVNGSVLGLSKSQITNLMDDIVDFAELSEFIDTPVRNYSSGMQVRLAFAVATATTPEVLLLDEVLAVGDASFRHKCYSRINKCIQNSAVVIVSHAMEQIANVASKVALMSHGRCDLYHNVAEGIAAYNQQNEEASGAINHDDQEFAIYPPIKSLTAEVETETIEYGASIVWHVTIDSEDSVGNCRIWIDATNAADQTVMCFDSTRQGLNCEVNKGKTHFHITIAPLLLHEGDYRWSIYVNKIGAIEQLVWGYRIGEFQVVGSHVANWGIPYLPHSSAFDCCTP